MTPNYNGARENSCGMKHVLAHYIHSSEVCSVQNLAEAQHSYNLIHMSVKLETKL